MTQTQSVMDAALYRARQHRDEDVADLIEELRIPSISTLVERRPDIQRNAHWLQHYFERLGLAAEVIDAGPDGRPVVVAESKGPSTLPHLTIYGHYDVQPPDPIDLWETPPFVPAVRDGAIYARGAADSKGNHMAAIKAVEHLLASGGLPLNVRFIIEGEEEITGQALPEFVRSHAEHLTTDAVLLWDGGFDEFGIPTIATALRGLLYVELHATGADIDLHSGTFGGVAPNPINTLARVLGELKDRNGRVTIPGFYDDVKSPSPEELEAWRAEDERYGEEMKRLAQARALEGEPDFNFHERTWSRPTLDVNGMLGGFVGEGQKTVIPSKAFAKVSMRLVPDQDWKKILESLESYAQTLSTPGVDISVKLLSPAPPVTAGADGPAADALRAAFKQTFGKETALIRVGGSIPAAADFQEALGVPIIISGIDTPDTLIHSPNEHFSIQQYHRGIEALIRYLCLYAASAHK